MKATIAILPGDGIGLEVTAAAVRVLDAVATACGHTWQSRALADRRGRARAGLPPLPDTTLAAATRADAVFLGAVGDSGVRCRAACAAARRPPCWR